MNDIESLAARVTGRDVPLFEADIARADGALRETLGGRRVLVVGGAGSIGGATVRALCAYSPASLHVLDQNENGLAELTRDIRSSGTVAPRDFRLLPLDFGGTTTERLLRDAPAYDVVFNFAAIKHVRSEKDVYSLLQLLETNVVKQARLLRWLADGSAPGHYFSVSTDKAANPVSFMGASKRAMEHVMFSRELAELPATVIGSARFANVAFSAGSLLESFTVRLAKRQPIAAPADTKRYFISMREAAQICLLAVACAPDAHVVVPRLDASTDLIEMQRIAELFLEQHGLTPQLLSDEGQARAAASSASGGRYPLLVTSRDTDGEKAYEEFVGEGEQVVDLGLTAAEAVRYDPARSGAVAQFVERIDALLSDATRPATKDDIGRWLSELVPTFRPQLTGQSLDDRM